VRLEDGAWSFDGQISIHELLEHLGLGESIDARRQYQTLSGLINEALGHLPSIGESVTRAGWVLEVTDMDGHRIDRVRATRERAAPAGIA
jgi:putative hemolysin